MSVKRPGSPFGSEPLEPLDPRDLPNARKVDPEKFAAVLSQLDAQEATAGAPVAGAGSAGAAAGSTRAQLEQIARDTDLSQPDEAARAVLEAAECLIWASLKKYTRTQQGQKLVDELGQLVEDLSGYVAHDPLLKSKLLSILMKIKAVQSS
jgi:hypothetical protein